MFVGTPSPGAAPSRLPGGETEVTGYLPVARFYLGEYYALQGHHYVGIGLVGCDGVFVRMPHRPKPAQTEQTRPTEHASTIQPKTIAEGIRVRGRGLPFKPPGLPSGPTLKFPQNTQGS